MTLSPLLHKGITSILGGVRVLVFAVTILFQLLVSSSVLAEVGITDSSQLIGAVSRIQGEAFIVSDTGKKRVLVGTRLSEGDRLETLPASRLKLQMVDNASLIIGSDANIYFRRYQYSRSKRRGIADIVISSGAFRSITGEIAKLQGELYTIKTPLAQVGVRGTDFWGGSLDGSSIEVALISGDSIYIENEAGSVVIDQVGYATKVVSQNTPPTTPQAWDQETFNQAVDTVTFGEDVR